MKRGIFTALCIVAVASIGYCGYFNWATSKTDVMASAAGQSAGLAWVQSEFGLSDAEFSVLEKANGDYMPRCEAMCMELARERRALAALVANADTAATEIESAYTKVNAMEQRCFRMTLEHIYEVSRSMEPEKGARYRRHMITELMGYRIGHHELLDAANHESN